MSLHAWAQWLSETPGSVALIESIYAYPVIESIHVWALALFIGFAALLDLRLLGLTLRQIPVSRLAARLLPWTAAGFVIMVITGALLFYAIPVRSYHSVWFRFKMVLLVLAGLNAWVFHSGVYRRAATWDLDPVPPRAARRAAAVSLLLWACIVFSGRMIAYSWFDCDRQPQPALVNFLAGCVADAE